MELQLVMTIIALDRPGLVELLAQVLVEHGGNWLESRMCRLGGQFAGLLRASIPAERETALKEALAGLAGRGLTVVAHVDRTSDAAVRPPMARLEVVGQDRPGIVRQIAQALARQGVNVEELETECVSAPMSGEALFKAQAKLQLPEGCSLARLREELEQIASDLLVEVTLRSEPETTACPASSSASRASGG